ncbi:MAG: hypothetical protein AAGK92_11665 [Pseudomonadota bacterium]
MSSRLIATVLIATLLAGCGTVRESRLNPFNWFGGSQEEVGFAPNDIVERLDNRPLIDQITSLRIERVQGGAVVHAVGLPPTQGHWEADLVLENRGRVDENGALVLQFKAFPSPTRTRQGTQASREVVAGTFLSDQTLAPARQITVRAQRNARTSRR